MDYYKEILSLIDKKDEKDIFEKARKWDILL